jgi:hypothetical protein
MAVLLDGEALSCRMLEVWSEGALLSLPDMPPIPDRITLLLAAMGARRECFVTWRQGCEIGVEFERA